MNDIYGKLLDIGIQNGDFLLTDSEIEDIIKVFESAGYHKDSPLQAFKRKNAMTGEYWAKRFHEVFDAMDIGYHGGFVDIDLVYEAVSKASELEEI